MDSDSVPHDLTDRGEGGAEEVQPETPPTGEKSRAPLDPPASFDRINTLLLSFVAFCFICFGVWVVSAGKRYRDEHAQATEGWRVGTTRMVELTLVRDDKHNLACNSAQEIAGLRCGGARDMSGVAADPQVLQPYNTIANELFLGAGLWNSPDLQGPLPEKRFTVVCNYHIKGVVKSASTRFGTKAAFAPLRKTVMVGTLTDCVIPR